MYLKRVVYANKISSMKRKKKKIQEEEDEEEPFSVLCPQKSIMVEIYFLTFNISYF